MMPPGMRRDRDLGLAVDVVKKEHVHVVGVVAGQEVHAVAGDVGVAAAPVLAIFDHGAEVAGQEYAVALAAQGGLHAVAEVGKGRRGQSS